MSQINYITPMNFIFCGINQGSPTPTIGTVKEEYLTGGKNHKIWLSDCLFSIINLLLVLLHYLGRRPSDS